MVTNTPAWQRLLDVLMSIAAVVFLLHLTLPYADEEEAPKELGSPSRLMRGKSEKDAAANAAVQELLND